MRPRHSQKLLYIIAVFFIAYCLFKWLYNIGTPIDEFFAVIPIYIVVSISKLFYAPRKDRKEERKKIRISLEFLSHAIIISMVVSTHNGGYPHLALKLAIYIFIELYGYYVRK